MGAPLYRDPEPRPTPAPLTRVEPPSRTWRAFLIGAIILLALVVIGVAIFLSGISGKAPAKPAPKPVAPGMMIAGYFG